MPASVASEIAKAGLAPHLLRRPLPGLEMVHVFVTDRSELASELPCSGRWSRPRAWSGSRGRKRVPEGRPIFPKTRSGRKLCRWTWWISKCVLWIRCGPAWSSWSQEQANKARPV